MIHRQTRTLPAYIVRYPPIAVKSAMGGLFCPLGRSFCPLSFPRHFRSHFAFLASTIRCWLLNSAIITAVNTSANTGRMP